MNQFKRLFSSYRNAFTRCYSSSNSKQRPITPWDFVKTETTPIKKIEPLNHLPIQEGIVGNNDKFWMSSPMVYECSTQRLNMLGRVISQLQLDAALLQMEMSPKGTAPMVLDLLLRMKKAVIDSGSDPALWYVKEAIVGRGEYRKFVDIKGRFRSGIIWKGHAQIKICLYRPNVSKIVERLLKIKKIPREDRPIGRKDYSYWSP